MIIVGKSSPIKLINHEIFFETYEHDLKLKLNQKLYYTNR